jgi:hypothetical protein
MHRIARFCLLALTLLPLGGCASEPLKAPVCDGKNRREVNLTPSVLLGSAGAPSPASTPLLSSSTHKGC